MDILRYQAADAETAVQLARMLSRQLGWDRASRLGGRDRMHPHSCVLIIKETRRVYIVRDCWDSDFNTVININASGGIT